MIIDLGLLVLVIIALSEMLKQFELMPKKYIPAVNLVFGIVGGVIYLTGDLKTNILLGIIMGLSASGLFDLSEVLNKDKPI